MITTSELHEEAENMRTWRARCEWFDEQASVMQEARKETRLRADECEKRVDAMNVILK